MPNAPDASVQPPIKPAKRPSKKGPVFLSILLLVVLSCWLVIRLNTDPCRIASSLAARNQLHSGELKYSLEAFGLIPVGIASITPYRVEQWHSGNVVQMNFTCQTLPFISKAFKASAMMATYADPATIVPLTVMQETRIKGKEPQVKEINYDPVRHTMTIGSMTRSIPPDTLDPLTLLLRLERADLSKLSTFDLNLNTNQKNYSVKGTVSSSSCDIRGKGVVQLFTVKASISRRDKNPYHQSAVEIVFLKDTDNIPILIRVSASGAFLSARLTQISG